MKRLLQGFVGLMLVVALCGGCATREGQTGGLLGAVVGGLSGAAIDGDNRFRGAAIGTALGALLGGAFGESIGQASHEAAVHNRTVRRNGPEGYYVESRPTRRDGNCQEVEEIVYDSYNRVQRQEFRRYCDLPDQHHQRPLPRPHQSLDQAMERAARQAVRIWSTAEVRTDDGYLVVAVPHRGQVRGCAQAHVTIFDRFNNRVGEDWREVCQNRRR
jgi:outer membrane lipoprotein SlyB